MSDLIKTLKSSETGNDVYPNIKPDNIPSDAITSAKINDGAVTTDKLADTSVTTAKIHNGAVTTAKIEDEGVSTAKIGNLAVTTAKIDTGAVTSAKIGDSAVTGTKINDGAVSYNKLASALKNLIDGKASQTDLETLQTAVNGKQPMIDSTHKLDADLVDDSTSANKFVTSAEKTKISDSASVSGTNAFTGTNSFEGSTIFNGAVQMQDDLDASAMSIDFENLTDNTNNDKDLKTYLSEKQNKLYHHNIIFDGGGTTAILTIINDSDTPFTESTLKSFLNSNGFINSNNFYLANGRASSYEGAIIVGVFFNTNDNDIYIVYAPLTESSGFYSIDSLDNESATISTFDDTIIPL